MSAGHNARAIRYKTGHRRWEAWCPEPGCGVLRDVDGQRAQSREGAEFISDEHARLTACHCYSPETLEWSLDLCPNCAAKETGVMTPLSLYACLTDQGVPREHVEAATTAVAVFLAEHWPAFIPYLDAQSAAQRAETLRLVSGEA